MGIYIHVPFCLGKCRYCDFYSLPLAQVKSQMDAYVSAVSREMAQAAAAHPELAAQEIATLYLGGGTPSLLSAAQLDHLLEAVHTHFRLASDAEITLEGNPGALDGEKATAFRALGVNRVSLGAQSFDDGLLQTLGRRHNAAQILEAVELLRAAGFDNLSLDLMFALPGQTLAAWEETLRQAIAAHPEHLSAYNLTIEAGTVFGEWQRQGKLPPADEDLEAEMFERGISILAAAGYEHYEISNFALPGRRSGHNQIYWHNEPYFGFGPAAASYLDGVRSVNTHSLSRYLTAIEQGESAAEFTEQLTGAAAMGETMMLGLRLRDGVKQERFAARFGITPAAAYPEQVRRLAASGLLQVDECRLALTHRGMLLANDVMA
ncbi:MAG TPA: radical SAM family heme chaperone HemW, partial [Armatimonadota bacterium]|nr:radical SAM family heme chaperone HemW [Armatimonadota bacterium]